MNLPSNPLSKVNFTHCPYWKRRGKVLWTGDLCESRGKNRLQKGAKVGAGSTNQGDPPDLGHPRGWSGYQSTRTILESENAVANNAQVEPWCGHLPESSRPETGKPLQLRCPQTTIHPSRPERVHGTREPAVHTRFHPGRSAGLP